MSTVSESIPTPDQAQSGDTQAGVYDPNDLEGPPPAAPRLDRGGDLRRLLRGGLLVAKFAPGTVGSIGRGMLREAISAQTAAVAIAVIGLNIHFGFTGLLNMGQAGFMLLGAYGFAISIWQGLPMPVGILIGFGAAFVFALMLGVPTLKLRGDYLAIVTISAAEIIRYIGRLARSRGLHRRGPGHPGSQYRDPFTNLSFFGDGTFDAGGWLPELPDHRRQRLVGAVRRLGARGAVLRSWSSCWCAAPGAACCAASARTRTRSAASARTSSRSRCRR